jgi:hypothetical protein
LGDASQLSAHSELAQSIKRPEKQGINEKSENNSLICRLNGGGESHSNPQSLFERAKRELLASYSLQRVAYSERRGD